MTDSKSSNDAEVSLKIPTIMTRRRTLKTLSTLSLVGLAGCGGGNSNSANSSGTNSSSSSSSSSNSSTSTSSSSTSSSSTSSSGGGSAGSCVLIPSETEGPYPLSAILSNSAMFRQDITEGKTGIPLTVKLRLLDINNSCASFPYAAFYIWHCDKDGVYSGYAQPGANAVGETFCRGLQEVDENGEATFITIYPGWYAGRITHIHFQVFLYGETSSPATVTSQLAFPEETTEVVYNSALYSAHGQNTSVAGFSQDNVFADGVEYQMALIEGDINQGFTATLEVGIVSS